MRNAVNFATGLCFALPLLISQGTPIHMWSTLIFTIVASFHHLIPERTEALIFVTKSLYTQFLFGILNMKFGIPMYPAYIISILDLLPILHYVKLEFYLGAMRQLICAILWYNSSNKYITLIVYLIGQFIYAVDRNLRFNVYKNRNMYTYYHALFHLCDVYCFTRWILSP